MADMMLETRIALRRHDSRIDFETILHNTTDNHRIQVIFDFNEKTRTHFADTQFGRIDRENEFARTPESETDHWSERYYPVFSQHKYVGITSDKGVGFLVLNKGLSQYQIYNENTTLLAVTLLSGVGFMGNENLKYRPGRRSGAVCATPGAQLKGLFHTEYAFLPVNTESCNNKLAENYINPPYAMNYAEYEAEGMLPENLTLVGSNAAALSLLKGSEDGKGFILRIYNPDNLYKEDVEIIFNRHLFKSVYLTDLAEQVVNMEDALVGKRNNADGSDPETLSGNIIFKAFKQNEIKTIKLLQHLR